MAIFFVFNDWPTLYILLTTNKYLKHPDIFSVLPYRFI